MRMRFGGKEINPHNQNHRCWAIDFEGLELELVTMDIGETYN